MGADMEQAAVTWPVEGTAKELRAGSGAVSREQAGAVRAHQEVANTVRSWVGSRKTATARAALQFVHWVSNP